MFNLDNPRVQVVLTIIVLAVYVTGVALMLKRKWLLEAQKVEIQLITKDGKVTIEGRKPDLVSIDDTGTVKIQWKKSRGSVTVHTPDGETEQVFLENTAYEWSCSEVIDWGMQVEL